MELDNISDKETRLKDIQDAIHCMKVLADQETCEECRYYPICDHTKQEDMANMSVFALKKLMLKEFAKKLDGREYRYPQFTKEEVQMAKDNGFVIVYGASDDLMEFEGAICDEGGCYDGGKVFFDRTGVSQNGEKRANMIEALWCDDAAENRAEDGTLIIWTYRTDIPHETFLITEDGEKYCRGIVFRLEDVK